eukprot:2732960-Rhodomonas_salina.1
MNLDLGSGGTVVLSGLDGAFSPGVWIRSVISASGSEGFLCYSGGLSGLGFWNQTQNAVLLEVCDGKVLLSSLLYEVSFNLTNPSIEQLSPAVSISAFTEGFSIAATAVVKGGELFGVPDGADPLRVVTPEFKISNVSQQVPFAATLNPLSFIVQMSVGASFADASAIRITGLVGAVISGPSVQIETDNTLSSAICDSSGTPGYVDWDTSDDTLTLNLCPGASIAANFLMQFSIENVNPTQNQDSPAVQIQLDGSRVAITAEDMEKPGIAGFGIPGAFDPLKVIIPRFEVRSMSQSTFLPGKSNTLSVTLLPTVNLEGADSSIISVTGLQGIPIGQVAVSAINATGPPKFCFNGTSNSAVVTSGPMLLLSICPSEALQAGEEHAFSFAILNPAASQISPQISIRASGTASFSVAAVQKLANELFGVSSGTSPLLIVEPLFDLRTLQRSSLLAGAQNEHVVSLEATVGMSFADFSVITISGLSGTSDHLDFVRISSSEENLYCNVDGIPNQAAYNASSGTLVFRVCEGRQLSADQPITISFNLTNPIAQTETSGFSIKMRGTEISISQQDLIAIGENLNGSLIIPTFEIKSISQTTPIASTSNVLDVTLQTNVNLNANHRIILSEMRNALVPGGVAALSGPDANTFCDMSNNPSQATWNSLQEQLEIKVCSEIRSFTEYRVKVTIQNPAEGQISPNITIQVQGTLNIEE